MKIDKEKEKKLRQHMKAYAIHYGFHVSSNSIYKSDATSFYCGNYVVVEKRKIVYRIGMKKMAYDNLFWSIMDMTENLKKKESIRVNGAFVAPLIELNNGTIEFDEDIESVAHSFIKTIVEEVDAFKNRNEDINTIVLQNTKQFYGADVLRSLALIDKGDIDSAKRLAEEHIGKSGFVNEGKDYFSRLVDFYKE